MAIQTDQVAAGRIASIAELLDVRLFESSSKLLEVVSVERPLSFEIEANPIIEHDSGSLYFILRIRYALTISSSHDSAAHRDNEQQSESTETASEVAHINFDFGALYHFDLMEGEPEVGQEELDAYARTAGVMCIYPYAREHVNYVTQQLGLPRLVLPIIKLPLVGSPEEKSYLKLVLRKQAKGTFRFAIQSRDDDTLASSSSYKSRSAALSKIREIIGNFPGVEFVDLTGSAESAALSSRIGY